ncbi:HTH-type transcriptional regulatory protein GabR [Ferrimicrobium acidiphilum DSM 19497]|uniref:HTH-type transcriptional regulatory protein GabR n=2 Tax=Ferrimicrobium acidiphilum TaxID=121039 RepID=A0A0D8FXC1_9ACTN|nr:HTH-type transcriptional regulatory protein GabR [Ferrimicrobium acidiphilum DSM 19497]
MTQTGFNVPNINSLRLNSTSMNERVSYHTTDEICQMIADTVNRSGMRGLTEAFVQLTKEGQLSSGDRLPSIRQLAEYLGVSPTTVASAWSHLAQLGLLSSHGRRGSFVTEFTRSVPTNPRWHFYEDQQSYSLDFASGVPDPRLLPNPITTIIDLPSSAISSYLDPPVYSPLGETLGTLVPSRLGGSDFDLTIVDGALDAVDRLLGTIPSHQRAVVLEEPNFPALYDLVERHGLEIRSVAIDHEGMSADGLRVELAKGGVGVVLLQPRSQNPTGYSLSESRAREIANVVGQYPEVLVVEDDHSGLLCTESLWTMAETLGTQVAYILSFSKSHGPDLRLAALFAHRDLVDELNRRRTLGPSWSSKLLQATLNQMLNNPATSDLILEAQHAYAQRRAAVADLFRIAPTGSGINVWVDSPDSLSALLQLTHHHIRVAPGASFYATPATASNQFRFTLSEPTVEFKVALDQVASALAKTPRTSSYR